MKEIFFIAAFACFSLAVFAQQKGKIIPPVSLPDANGKQVAVSSLKGKVVLIDFWASWCGPCRRNNLLLHKLYEKYAGKGFEIYGISVDNDLNEWKQAVGEDHINWLQVNDAAGNVANDWQISYIPQTFLVDKTGKLIAVDEDENKLDKMIGKLLQ